MATYTDSAARRDEGIELAVTKADKDIDGWSDDAYQALVYFATAVGIGHRFLAEDVRAFADFKMLVIKPENERAWGAVMRKAASNGLIQKVGYQLAKSSNLSPKCQWEVKQ
jgi:hypothetical protein